ncbi:polysaccharide deacetylase [Pseudomonas sp. Cab53]|uniref:Polysaccharide deacetylase n=2 Tax=Pseudomonas TaxID=286 RepID=A0A0G3GFY2_9PSED|nr:MULTISPECIES: polysaccharide deacetylase family protein [Pseudomonas]AKK00049.1 polysaccharide deacetylase [Pseudomonas chlororaphis]KIQ57499.1 polysaccharide deacetylase [Pseudomonas fluorescens]BBP64915.1 polysaccharide deacetylase [Pseudomonas sp. Cab53]
MNIIARALVIAGLAVGVSGCIGPPIELTPQTEQRLREQPPIRFLLTFDDGPSASSFWNPSQEVLDALAQNPVQPGIKAVFFLQTRAARAGNSHIGRSVMHREQREGHVLAFHTATHWHTNHRFLSPDELEQSLVDGGNDIAGISGATPRLVRPPFWSYDRRTFAAYQRHGMHVLLTDLSANDGKVWGITASPRRRINLVRQLSEVRERIAAGQLPAVDGVIPVVVTFHDINRYTARHAREYLQILLDSARETGVRTDAKPFYDDHQALERAALARTVRNSGQPVHLPGLWDWLWDSDAH